MDLGDGTARRPGASAIVVLAAFLLYGCSPSQLDDKQLAFCYSDARTVPLLNAGEALGALRRDDMSTFRTRNLKAVDTASAWRSAEPYDFERACRAILPAGREGSSLNWNNFLSVALGAAIALGTTQANELARLQREYKRELKKSVERMRTTLADHLAEWRLATSPPPTSLVLEAITDVSSQIANTRSERAKSAQTSLQSLRDALRNLAVATDRKTRESRIARIEESLPNLVEELAATRKFGRAKDAPRQIKFEDD